MEFSLLHTGLALTGLASVMIPIALHLILRQRPRSFVFPALQLVQLRHRATQRKLRFRHLLLLLLRMLVLALLAFCLGRPRLGGIVGDQSDGPIAAVFLFDNSLSMQYRYENTTRLKVAQQMAVELLMTLPRGSRVNIQETSAQSGDYADESTQPNPFEWFSDFGVAQELIENLEIRAMSAPMHVALKESMSKFSDMSVEFQRNVIYVFSDMARKDWEGMQQEWQPTQVKSQEPEIYLLDVGVDQSSNIAVTSVTPSRQVLLPGAQVTLQTVVQWFDNEDSTLQIKGTDPTAVQNDNEHSEQRVVELYLPLVTGQPSSKLAHRVVDIFPNRSQQLTFPLPELEEGLYQGKIQIMGGGDGLRVDDTRYISLEVRPRLKVLVVGRERDTVYWNAALEAVGSYEVSPVEVQNFNREQLMQHHVVVMVDVPELTDSIWETLYEFTSQGGGVSIFSGDRIRVDNYNGSVAQRLLPARLTAVHSADPASYLNPEDFGHPVLDGFREWSDSEVWQLLPFYRYLQTEMVPSATVIMQFANRAPALMERTIGNGRVLLFSSSVSDHPGMERWNELTSLGPADWMFLVLADQITQYVAGYSGERVNYDSDDGMIHIGLSKNQEEEALFVRDPEGVERIIKRDPIANELAIEVPSQLGNFVIDSKTRSVPMAKGFSLNIARRECDLRRFDAMESLSEQLNSIFGEDKYQIARAVGDLELAVQSRRQGMELAPLLMTLLLICLGMESLVAGRFYSIPQREGASTRSWNLFGSGTITLLGLGLGLLACIGPLRAFYSLLFSGNETSGWLVHLSELTVGIVVLSVALIFAYRFWVKEWPQLMERSWK